MARSGHCEAIRIHPNFNLNTKIKFFTSKILDKNKKCNIFHYIDNQLEFIFINVVLFFEAIIYSYYIPPA